MHTSIAIAESKTAQDAKYWVLLIDKTTYKHDDQDKTGDKGVGTPFICREGPDGKDGFISRIKYSKLSQEFKPALHCQYLHTSM